MKTFDHCQNCQYQTFKWPYQLYKSKYEVFFFVKRNTITLFHKYQIFSFLQDHLHFFVHFLFIFMEYLFIVYPIFFTLTQSFLHEYIISPSDPPKFTCPRLAPSSEVPTSVHRLRPADIKIVAALGDSLTAGTILYNLQHSRVWA